MKYIGFLETGKPAGRIQPDHGWGSLTSRDPAHGNAPDPALPTDQNDPATPQTPDRHCVARGPVVRSRHAIRQAAAG